MLSPQGLSISRKPSRVDASLGPGLGPFSNIQVERAALQEPRRTKAEPRQMKAELRENQAESSISWFGGRRQGEAVGLPMEASLGRVRDELPLEEARSKARRATGGSQKDNQKKHAYRAPPLPP